MIQKGNIKAADVIIFLPRSLAIKLLRNGDYDFFKL